MRVTNLPGDDKEVLISKLKKAFNKHGKVLYVKIVTAKSGTAYVVSNCSHKLKVKIMFGEFGTA